MVTEVFKSIGTSSRDYSTIASWNSAIPTNLLSGDNTSNTQAGSTTSTIVLDSLSSSTDGYYVGKTVTCAGEERLITGYVGATKTATIGALNGSSATWSSAPGTGVSFSTHSVSWTGQLYNDAEFNLTATLSIASGVTVDSTHIVKLTTGAGQSYIDNASVLTLPLRYDQTKGVAIKTTTTYVQILKFNGSSTILEKFQLKFGGSAAYVPLQAGDTNRTAIVRNVLGEITVSASYLFGNINSGSVFENCQGVDLSSTGAAGVFAGAYSQKFYNCTAARPSDLTAGGTGFATAANGTHPDAQNCASFGFNTCYSASNWGTCNNNASSDASAPGTSAQTSKTFANQFTTVTNTARDWRVKSGADLINNAVRDQTHTNDQDLILQTRSTSTPTIGAYEYIAAATVIQRRTLGQRIGTRAS